MPLMIIYIFVAAAIGLLIIGVIYSPKERAKERIRLPIEESSVTRNSISKTIIRIIPFTKIILDRLGIELKIRRKLDAAHIKLTPQGYFNLKLVLMLLLSVLVVFAGGKADILSLSVPMIFGWVIPDMLLNMKIVKRREAIVFQLPETVDLLGLCVEGGLDFAAAIKWVINKTPRNYLSEELALLLEEIKLGKVRTQALKDMGKRLNIS